MGTGAKNTRRKITMKTPRLDLRDYDTDAYDCIHIFSSQNGSPVAVLLNKTSDTPHWCVLRNCHDIHFSSYSQAMDFCAKRGWTNN